MRRVRTSHDEHIKFLYGLQAHGVKLGLRGMRVLSRLAGDPHNRFPSVHIAGSNGKGSVAAMLASVLTESGLKTGLYTSPHLVDFSERIRIDGRPISSGALDQLIDTLRPSIERNKSTFFESATVMGFRHFAESRVDMAVVEVGLGGRLDATNIITPLVSAVTSISREHVHILGHRLGAIAREKGGIIKKRVPVVIGHMSAGAGRVLRRLAGQHDAPLQSVHGASMVVHREGISGTRFGIRIGNIKYRSLDLPLPGRHQLQNAATVLRIVGILRERYGYDISDQSVRDGFASVQENTGFRGRLAPVPGFRNVLIDVAHNPESVRKSVETLRRCGVGKIIVVFGVMRDKEVAPMAESLAKVSDFCFAVQARSDRALAVRLLVNVLERKGIHCAGSPSVRRGVELAMALAKQNEMVVILGSHFVVGEALAYLEGRKYLTIDQ